MKPSVRAWPFESKYLRDFAVVEERHNGLRLFPATDQLPLLSQAINREFEYGLTSRLAHTDSRADNWRKLCLWRAADSFCQYLNSSRPDHLHVQPYYTPELLTQVAIVQEVTRSTPQGNHHWFRYFRDRAFLPDIHLGGKRVIFTTHAIDRYAQRADESNLHPINRLLTDFWHTVPLILHLDANTPAFVFHAGGTLAAMPFQMTSEEIICLTTLTPHEIKSLAPYDKPVRTHFHYGPQHPTSTCHNFDLAKHTDGLLQKWRDKAPREDMRKAYDTLGHLTWTKHVQYTPHRLRAQGCTPDSALVFYDGVPGPTVLTTHTTLPSIPAQPAPVGLPRS